MNDHHDFKPLTQIKDHHGFIPVAQIKEDHVLRPLIQIQGCHDFIDIVTGCDGVNFFLVVVVVVVYRKVDHERVPVVWILQGCFFGYRIQCEHAAPAWNPCCSPRQVGFLFAADGVLSCCSPVACFPRGTCFLCLNLWTALCCLQARVGGLTNRTGVENTAVSRWVITVLEIRLNQVSPKIGKLFL